MSFAGVIGRVLLLMIPRRLKVAGLFKEKLKEDFDWNNAVFRDPSTSVCNIFDAQPSMDFALLVWLWIGLAPVLRWSYQHGTVIDDTTRIYRYWTL